MLGIKLWNNTAGRYKAVLVDDSGNMKVSVAAGAAASSSPAQAGDAAATSHATPGTAQTTGRRPCKWRSTGQPTWTKSRRVTR
jgi:hypothetical protein